VFRKAGGTILSGWGILEHPLHREGGRRRTSPRGALVGPRGGLFPYDPADL